MHKNELINRGKEPLSSGAGTMAESIKALLLPVFERYADSVVFAYLFGSSAKEEVTALSDIDIAVYFSYGTREFHSDTKLSLYADLCRALRSNDIDLVILNTSRNIVLLDEIVRNAVVLYERDSDLREDFEVKVLHRAIDFKEQRLAVMGL
jgi:predicted nucleotidyltransferase